MSQEYFFNNLRYLRKKHKITQADMAEILGIKCSTYAHWETESTTVPTSIEFQNAIFNTFNFTLGYLLCNDLTNKSPIVNDNKMLDKLLGKVNYLTAELEKIKEDINNFRL